MKQFSLLEIVVLLLLLLLLLLAVDLEVETSRMPLLQMHTSSNRTVSVNGLNHFSNTIHAGTGQLMEGMCLTAPHPKASVPIGKCQVVLWAVCVEPAPSFPLHAQQNAVMKESHFGRFNSSMHIVFPRVLMHQFE